ncbi:MAG: hypothetical protein JSV09_13790 [Thermoplasmata archaeon]|nr:MAG: hypothetical protein JSV09_13790 [Thermoplasmata archaeon]
MEDTEEKHHSYKELKKMAKQQKKAKKKDKKKAKMEKKITKKEAKMRKKGMFLEDVSTEEETVAEEDVEVFEATPWVRKSTEGIPYLEKKIDRMAERRESSSLHQMFEEKYGESLTIPETYREYELTDSEKRRLEEITGKEEAEEPVEVIAVKSDETAEVSEETEVKEEKKKVVKGKLKPIYYPFQLWIYTKYGQDKPTILKVIILIISGALLVLSLPFRLVIWIIITLINKIKSRKTKKVKAEATEATEA